jgi:predicted ATPase/DNA-binding SARP family transcriptional activator/Tfp pilus assembly protein PilF
MEARCTIQLLGGLCIRQQERQISRFNTHKTGALLAYLAYHRRQAHPREVLIELLWPDRVPQAGRGSLSMALSSLRHQLEPPGVPAGAVILADRFTVQLNPDAVTTDAAEFETALRSAAQARSRSEQGQRLTMAVERYSGELLPGYYEDWILTERQRLSDLFVQALSRLITHLEQAGEREQALRYAYRAVGADPLREEAYRALMRLYAATGQPVSGLRVYAQLKRLFKRELGEAPSPATSQLARELLRQRAEEAAKGRSGETERRQSEHPRLPLPASRPDSLPAGTVTFLCTEIESATMPCEREGETRRSALETHRALLRGAFRQQGGYAFREAMDSFQVAFASASDALACAIAGQRALTAHPWPPEVGPLRARMALHTGDVQVQTGEYRGPVLQRAAGLLAAAHGGQILCSEATAGLLRRDLEPGLHFVNLGVYRLHDLPTPERLFLVAHPDLPPQECPPPGVPTGYGGHLPLQFTRFFGREQELAQLLAQLTPATARPRLVTLTGAGGIGKTRLAVEAARRLEEAWQGAVWFVPLADLSDVRLIASAIVEAMGQPCLSRAEPLQQAVEALSSQPSFLVLDNFEHLVDAGTMVVQTLLERVPTLTCLVTSRHLLGLTGERELFVRPLPIPQERETPEQLSQVESVRLFVDRAQAVKPDFQVTPQNALAVAELCDRLEGIPLAIELAAGRAQVLTPAQMLAQLENRFDFLVSRRRDVAARHRTLREAIEWSFRLLAPDLQRFFAGLSVFRGGWSLEAAETVCEAGASEDAGPGPGLALDYLAQLRDCSLILTEEAGPGASAMRFRMLETLRAYATEQLTAGERAALRERHRDCFLALAEAAEPHLLDAEQMAWLERLETEHDNLRAATEWRGTQESAGAGLRLAIALRRFWEIRGYAREGRLYLADLLAQEQAAPRTALRASALIGAGRLAEVQGDYAAARALYEESLAIARESGERPGLAESLYHLGVLAQEQGDYGAARLLLEESLAIRREFGDSAGVAASLNALGNVASHRGDYAAARRLYEESLTLRRALEDRRGIAASLTNLGLLLHEQGDAASARALHTESLALHRALGDKSGAAASLTNLGRVATDEGDFAAARTLFEETLAIRRELGEKQGIATSLNNLGVVALYQEDFPAARAFFEESLTLRRLLGARRGIASSLANLGHVTWKLQDYTVARSLAEQSLAILCELADKRGIADRLEMFALLDASEGQPARAARLFGAAEALRADIAAPLAAVEREEYAPHIARVREALGEAAFAAAWAQGHSMTPEQAVDCALDRTDAPGRKS